MMWSRFVMSQVKHNSYFLCGVALGLWVSLAAIPLDEEAPCAAAEAAAGAARGAGGAPDEFEPRREERPLGPAPPPASRSVQRPRYYSTELGMRGSLLAGVLSSEGALHTQVPALNHTLARLQPALKFFITASTVSSVPGLANVVGFTDTREMLKPFHALKYLADNYLEEYDFFFLVSDGTFVNARRLAALAAALSVSQDVYMGSPPHDDSHYCSLESGILLSNSVLRAVHSELDWCVRNSYSPHHHENVGRCVLHAAHLSCSQTHQGEHYTSVPLPPSPSPSSPSSPPPPLSPALARAVTAHPAPADHMLLLHAYIARVELERARDEALRLRVELLKLAGRHPPHARNATWPAGLRADPGLAPPAPDTRFDLRRWTLFNATHAFMPDELRAAGPLAEPHALVVGEVLSWARARWAGVGAGGAELAEGAWQWDPPRGLRYRLLLRLSGPDVSVLRWVEAARALGAARLVPVRYVTEGARVWVVVAVPAAPGAVAAAVAHAHRHKQLANTNIIFVTFPSGEPNATRAALAPLLAALPALPAARALPAPPAPAAPPAALGEVEWYERAGREAARVVRDAGAVGGDELVLLAPPHLEYNQDFLNRVRMNTLRGSSWFLPLPFARHALGAHPRRRGAGGAGAGGAGGGGRFNPHARAVLAFYMEDLAGAERAWRGAPTAGAAAVLGGAGGAGGGLRAHVAPDPAALLPPRPAPPAHTHTHTLDLGTRGALAQLLLEVQHDAE